MAETVVAEPGDRGARAPDDSFSFTSRGRKIIAAAVAIIGVVLVAIVLVVPSISSSGKSSKNVNSSGIGVAQDNLRGADVLGVAKSNNVVPSESSFSRSSGDVDGADDGDGALTETTNTNIITVNKYEGDISNSIEHANKEIALPIVRQKSSSFGATGCPIGEGLWNLILLTDDYPWETKWELYRQNDVDNDDDGIKMASGPPEGKNYARRTKYTGNMCLPSGDYYMRWYDLMGDSICCEYGSGEWTASVNGNVVTGSKVDSSDDIGFKQRDYPFYVPGSVMEDEVRGTFLMPRLQVEMADGTTFTLINVPSGMSIDNNDNFAKGFVSGATLITLPAGSEFFSNATVDMKGKPFRVVGKLDMPVNRFQGQKSILLVRADVADGATSLDETSLSNSIFGNGVDTVNLVSQYKACSYGKLNFVKAQVRRGSSDNSGDVSISSGIVTVRLPYMSTSQGDSAMRNSITRELNEIFSVASPSELADYAIYCLPPGAFSGSLFSKIGYAYYNSWLSVFNDDWCTSLSLQVHEMGHLLSLGHSNEGDERYGDRTGYMGPSYRSADGPMMCFNAAKSYQSGWYKDKEITVNSNNDATNCFDGILHGVADYPIATVVLLKIQNQSGDDYFVNFNSQRGVNVRTQEAGNEVTVVSRPRGVRDSFAESQLVAKLGTGESHAIMGYMISVGVIDTNVGTAEVTVLPKGRIVCDTP